MSENNGFVVVRYGVVPSTDYRVLAYGKEAFSEAISRNVVEERPFWDGSTANHIPVGGQYAVISDEADEYDLRAIREKHELEDEMNGVPVLNEEGELETVNPVELEDL